MKGNPFSNFKFQNQTDKKLPFVSREGETALVSKILLNTTTLFISVVSLMAQKKDS